VRVAFAKRCLEQQRLEIEDAFDSDCVTLGQSFANLGPPTSRPACRHGPRVQLGIPLQLEHGRDALDQRDGCIRNRQNGRAFTRTDLRFDELPRMEVIVGVVDFDTNALAPCGFIKLVVQLYDTALNPVTLPVRDANRRSYLEFGQVSGKAHGQARRVRQ